MGEAAKEWMAAVEDPSRLVAENSKLRDELGERDQYIARLEMRYENDANGYAEREKQLVAEIERLKAELDAAPKWVPVGEFENDSKFHIVWDADEEEAFDAKMQKRSGKWLAAYATERSLNVTHVLANLRPPVSERTIERVATQTIDGSLEAKLAEKPIEWPRPDDPRGDGDLEPKVSMSANELNAIVDGWDSDDWKVVAGNDQHIVADAFDKMIEVTKSAEEDAIRERLMQPFLGSEAEKLGAMSYKLRDGERWEFSAVGQWISTKHPTWEQARKYRLATACKHEHIKTIPGTPYDVYSIECADCGKVVS